MQKLNQLCIWCEAVKNVIFYVILALFIGDVVFQKYDTTGKTILLFASSGGSPFEPSVTTISKVAPKAKLGDALLVNDTGLVNPCLTILLNEIEDTFLTQAKAKGKTTSTNNYEFYWKR